MEREAKAKQDLEDAQKQERNINRVWRKDRDFAYRQGVEATKQERDQKREIRNRLAKGMIIKQSDPILVPVVDLEEVWWSQQPPERQVLRKQKRGVPKLKLSPRLVHQEDDTELIIDTEGDIKLRQDFLPFPELAGLKSDGLIQIVVEILTIL
jgi:hypothetical protein